MDWDESRPMAAGRRDGGPGSPVGSPVDDRPELALSAAPDVGALSDDDGSDESDGRRRSEPRTRPPSPPPRANNAGPGAGAGEPEERPRRPPEAPPKPPRRASEPDRRLSCSADLPLAPPRLARANTETDATWSIRLSGSPQGNSRRLADFCASVSGLLSLHGGDGLRSSGLVWGRVLPLHADLLRGVQVNVTVAADRSPYRLSLSTPASWTVGSLLDSLLHVLDVGPGRDERYLLKICGSEEFLRNGEILGKHESVRRFLQRQHAEVPLRLLRRDAANNELARDGEDEKHPFTVTRLMGLAYVFNTSRSVLENQLDSYSKELRRTMSSKRWTNVSQIAEEVRRVCSLLSDVSSREVEDAIAEIRRPDPDPDKCERRLRELHEALRELLRAFFSNFEWDVGCEEAPPARPAADAARRDDVLRLDLAALYRVKPAWLSSFDSFSVSCKLTYGSRELCETALSENISTALSLGNKLRCSRMMVFPVQIDKLPYESTLTFRMSGSKKGKVPEPLGWAVLPLFGNRTLVSGTVLLSMSTLPEPSGLPAPALSDGHRQATGVILQLGFPDARRWEYEWPRALPEPVLATPPFEELRQKIGDISRKRCPLLLTENERAFLWDRRHFCAEDSTYVHLLLGSAPRWAPEDLAEIYGILEHWPLRNPEDALFLLCFLDQKVRRVAIRHVEQFSDEDLEEYLPQLVQALKLEWELDGPLVLLLLRRSLQSVRVAQQFYWLLEDALQDLHYRSWYGKVQAALKHCCGRRLRRELENERRLVKVLGQAANKIRTAEKSQRKEALKREIINMGDFFKGGVSCRLPLDPAVLVDGVDSEACAFYSANSSPLKISLVNADGEGGNVAVICKTGDNLRQDMLVLQMVRAMDRVWLQAGLDMRMVTYRCLSTGRDQGLVEVVPEAVTLAKIQQEWGLGGALREDTLEKWFHTWNGTEEAYEEAVVNFLHSCAGWCVATFILGICDRHNDNIMLKHSGHMFHIDFGRIVGNAQTFGAIKRDRRPFIFTSEMRHFITGGGRKPQRFHRFVELCCEAYNGVRKRAALLLSLLQLMLGAGMPELKDSQDLRYVHSHLRLQDSELEATSYFTRMIEESMHSLPVKINFLIHSMGQSASAQRLAVEATRTSPRSNIQGAVIQKYSAMGRQVVYELKVTIEDGYLISKKTFRQFEMIHKALQRLFVESVLPRFPGWYKMSFTPRRRMSLLNKYLKDLFTGPCKGNEFVCSLFLDGPQTDVAPKASGQDAVPLTAPQVQLCMTYEDHKLSVLVKHLKNIRLPDGTSPDTSVVTRLRPDPENCSERKTRVVRNNRHPTFNQLMEYSDVHTLQGKVLQVQVKSRKAFLAETNIWLEDRKMGTEEWFLLGSCSN